jgi:uncharacterized protein (DUF1501 family)
MSADLSRRVFLRGAGVAAVGVGFHPSSLLVRAAQAAEAGTQVLVQVFLRGGADGLNQVVPFGDPDYYDLRRDIALPRPGQSGGVSNLDGYFGLHPELAALLPLWQEGRLAILPAVGNYALTRSHFDAQDFMETGTPGVKTTADGWLDRSIARISGSEVTQAVAFAAVLPRSFLGGEPVLVAQNLATFDLRARAWRTEAETLLRAMYEPRGDALGQVGRETFSAIQTLARSPSLLAGPTNGAIYPNAGVGTSLRQAASVIKAGLGTRCIFVNVTGAFDTHANQLTANTNDYRSLGPALAAFATDLGQKLDDVVVMVNTEFGRTSAVNGSGGTDHGASHCMFVFGGRVRGGRIVGRWPGLSRADLHEGRDLALSVDYRDAFQEIARTQLGISESLFPGYTPGPGPGIMA